MKGQDISQIIGGMLSILFVIMIMGVLFSALSGLSCSSEKATIASKDTEIGTLKNTIDAVNATAILYKEQYENLTNTMITKKDFVDIQNSVNQTQYQISNIINKVDYLSQQVVNIQNVQNIYFTFYFSIAINLLSAGFLLVDFTFFNFDLSKRIAKFVLGRVKKHNSSNEHHNEENP